MYRDIVPAKTTDFAVMFLLTEGLYVEVLQNVALFAELRGKYKVTASGVFVAPTFICCSYK
ncbi:MAG: hypothetical protein LBJ38_00595 [Oscillospiraceae bacterium]|jgi:DNA recombination protein RmuC|nr:hypothetical protein [Oscillospiraceae bacterium]